MVYMLTLSAFKDEAFIDVMVVMEQILLRCVLHSCGSTRCGQGC